MSKGKVENRMMFSGNMNSVDFDVMYRVKLKRICMGFSQEETAFLMGKDRNYITLKEQFAPKDVYKLSDIGKLAIVLNIENPTFVPRYSIANKVNNYVGYEKREDGRIIHEVYIREKTKKSNKLVFKIEEDDPNYVKFPNSESIKLNDLKLLLSTLCQIGYFLEARPAWLIFSYCSRTVRHHVSPKLVEQAIDHFIKEKKIGRVNESGCFSYKSTTIKRANLSSTKTN